MARWFAVLCAALTLAGLGGCAGTAPSVTPSSTASVLATVTPTRTSPAETASPRPTLSGNGPCRDDLALPAGRREITSAQTETPFGVEITFTDGWKGCGLAFKELGPPFGLMMVGYWDARMVYPDPCHWKGDVNGPDVGRSVDDLMAALAAQKLTEAGAIQGMTLDGYVGKYLRFEVPSSVDTTGCDQDKPNLEAEFRFWNGPGESVWWLGAKDAPGLIGEVWALDVNGFRFVVQAASFADAPESRRDEIHDIVASIDIKP